MFVIFALVLTQANPSPNRKSTPNLRDNARVQELEEEVQELKRKLERADSRVVSVFATYAQVPYANHFVHCSTSFLLRTMLLDISSPQSPPNSFTLSTEGRHVRLFVPGGGPRTRAERGHRADQQTQGREGTARHIRAGIFIIVSTHSELLSTGGVCTNY